MTTLVVGQVAPRFSLLGLNGQTRALEDVGAPLLLVFFKNACHTCHLTFPYLQKLYQAYPHNAWRFWVVSQDDATETGSFAAQYNLTMPILLDSDWRVSKDYALQFVPTFFWVAPNGHLEHVSAGFRKDDLDALNQRVASLVGAAPVELFGPDDTAPAFRPG